MSESSTPDFSPEHARRRPPSVTPGTRIGAYTVEEWIASGGWSQVYRARSVNEGACAIKLLDRKGSFENEINVALKLNHENIIEIREVATFDGRVALVMPYCRDGTLADLLRDGPLSVERAAFALMQIADGLDHAHASGFVHGDLKPSNVLVTDAFSPRIVISDFGLARVEAHEPGVPRGTIPYEAPEVLRGQPPTRASDAFAVGAVAYELLTGTRAFPKTPGPRTAPDFERLAGAPEKLVALIRALLDDDSAARPTIRDARFIFEQVWRRAASPPLLVGGVIAAVLLIVTGAFTWMIVTRPDPAPPPRVQTTRTSRSSAPPSTVRVTEPIAPEPEPVALATATTTKAETVAAAQLVPMSLDRLPNGIPGGLTGLFGNSRCTNESDLKKRRPFNLVVWRRDPDARWYMVFRNGRIYRQVTETQIEDYDVEVGKTYMYFVQACNEYGCGAQSTTYRVTAVTLVCNAELPRCNGITVSNTSGDVPLAVTFSANATSFTGAKPGIFWDFGDGQLLGGLTDVTHTFVKPGTYPVRAHAYDAVGTSPFVPECATTIEVGGEALDVRRAAMLWREESASRPGSPYVSALPRTGTVETDFVFTAEPPAMYGKPIAYRWDFNESALPSWTPRSPNASITHRFTRTSYPSSTMVRVEVTFEDGQIVDLGGTDVWIIPPDVAELEKKLRE